MMHFLSLWHMRNKRVARQMVSRQRLTIAGSRWEELQREYSNLAAEKFYEEYPDQRPPQPVT